MRVISGTAGGKNLKTLSGGDIVRPTTDRVKEAVFSSIQFITEGACFLDLFSGSGQIGIEALSRGAKNAYFIDSSKNSIDVIKSNLKTVGFEDKSYVVHSDFKTFLNNTNEKFDIIFLDPPYKTGLLQEALPYAIKCINKNGRILCECPIDEELPEVVGDFIAFRKYKYGNIKITAYAHPDYV